MGCINTSAKKEIASRQTRTSNADNIPITPIIFRRPSFENYSSNYVEIRKLGSGAFSNVMLCLHKPTQTQRAVKIIKRSLLCNSQADSVYFVKEFKILREMDHPNILRCFEVFENSKWCYVATEYCPAGDLFTEIIKLKKFSESHTSEIIKQVLSVLVYCHERGVIHRDLKPENIFLMEKDQNLTIKVGDFGNSVEFNKDLKISGCYGSAYYIAPEVFTDSYNETCDIWSAGIIMYILLTGRAPYSMKNNQMIIDNIKTSPFRLTSSNAAGLSSDAVNLLESMLKLNIKKRISAKEALLHPWFSNFSKHQSKESGNILKDLMNFHNESKLKEAIQVFITSQISTFEDIKQFQSCFEDIDKDHDGKISKDELINAYAKIMPHENAEAVAKDLISKLDYDFDGNIEYTEFLASCSLRQKNISLEKLEYAFNMFDTDRSGTISVDEIRGFLGSGLAEADKVWTQILQEADKNGDGVIDLAEFLTLMNNKISI